MSIDGTELWLAQYQLGQHMLDYMTAKIVMILAIFFSSLPPISLPRPEYMLASLPNAVLIAIVIFAISISVADLLAKKHNYTINSSQVYSFNDLCKKDSTSLIMCICSTNLTSSLLLIYKWYM